MGRHVGRHPGIRRRIARARETAPKGTARGVWQRGPAASNPATGAASRRRPGSGAPRREGLSRAIIMTKALFTGRPKNESIPRSNLDSHICAANPPCGPHPVLAAQSRLEAAPRRAPWKRSHDSRGATDSPRPDADLSVGRKGVSRRDVGPYHDKTRASGTTSFPPYRPVGHFAREECTARNGRLRASGGRIAASRVGRRGSARTCGESASWRRI
jgi:hypothetical protein